MADVEDTLKLGTFANPHKVAPPGWLEHGVDWGAICKCHKCGLVGTSTFMFDFYAKKEGDPLTCENCSRAEWFR